jgi:hypothetical protein
MLKQAALLANAGIAFSPGQRIVDGGTQPQVSHMKFIVVATLISLLAACGGGDDESDPARGVSCSERPVACQ